MILPNEAAEESNPRAGDLLVPPGLGDNVPPQIENADALDLDDPVSTEQQKSGDCSQCEIFHMIL